MSTARDPNIVSKTGDISVAGNAHAVAHDHSRIFAGIFLIAAIAAACRKIISSAFQPFEADPALDYFSTVLIPNYYEHGFIRRGLGGTMFSALQAALGTHGLVSYFAFHIASAIWLAVPMAILLSRLTLKGGKLWLWFGVVMVCSPHLFLGWSAASLPLTDMLTGGFIAWALLASLNGRFALAATVCVAGVTAHETAVIYGLPLLIAMWALDFERNRTSLRSGITAGALFAALLTAIYVLQWALSGDRDAVIRSMRAFEASDLYLRDAAIYMTLGGLRTIVASHCSSLGRPGIGAILLAPYVVLGLYALAFLVRTPKHLAVFAFVSVVPLAFMMLVAIDYGRWLMFAVLNGWLATVGLFLRSGRPFLRERTVGIAAVVLAALFLMRAPTGAAANRLVGSIWVSGWGWPAVGLKSLDECDPSWRSVFERGH